MNKRKQNFEVRSEETICMSDGRSQTPDWILGTDTSSFDLSQSVFNDDFLDLLELPLTGLNGEDELDVENREVFQDLRFTSTPKSRSTTDSGLGTSKRTPLIDTPSQPSIHVLHDITSKLNDLDNSFINISQRSDSSTSSSTSQVSFKRRVGILRKSISTTTHLKLEKKEVSVISKDQMIYYSGIQDYNKAIAILKHIKLPKKCISSFKMELMTLMKLRLDLEWQDMSYRFAVSELSVIDIVQTTVDILSQSLEEFLPWNSSKSVLRKTTRSFYVHDFNNSGLSHVIMVLAESRKTVLFVSQSYSCDSTPIMIFLDQCGNQVAAGDIVCVSGETGENLFYQVEATSCVTLVDPAVFLNNYYFVELCRQTVEKMIKVFTLLSRPSASFFDISKLVKIAGALTNLNKMSDISFAQLKKIYERSSQCLQIA